MDYNNNPYPQPNNNYYQNGPNQLFRNPGQAMAMASLILGVASIFTLLTIYLPLVFGSMAIVLAILSKGYGKKMLGIARAGIGTAIGAMTLVVAIWGTIISFFLSLSGDALIEFGRQIDQQFEQQTGRDIEDLTGISYEELMRMYAESMGK